ncbi:MAG: hypothetical protein RBG13Loki_4390 [Promethearchaeota archaeon CR_4]|nr:MAG: hypothetical protein RBG13Loki_4390 [Candidatus Lokiarchaeota archaeon CR_4]
MDAGLGSAGTGKAPPLIPIVNIATMLANNVTPRKPRARNFRPEYFRSILHSPLMIGIKICYTIFYYQRSVRVSLFKCWEDNRVQDGLVANDGIILDLIQILPISCGEFYTLLRIPS